MLTVQYAKDPVWANQAQTEINLTVKFVEFTNEVPFTATPTDDTTYGLELFGNAEAGEYGAIAPYVPPPIRITPTRLPDGVTGGAYITTLNATGGTAPYTYALASGALPNNLRIQASDILGDLSSASAGNYEFTVRATDSTGRTGNTAITMTVYSTSE